MQGNTIFRSPSSSQEARLSRVHVDGPGFPSCREIAVYGRLCSPVHDALASLAKKPSPRLRVRSQQVGQDSRVTKASPPGTRSSSPWILFRLQSEQQRGERRSSCSCCRPNLLTLSCSNVRRRRRARSEKQASLARRRRALYLEGRRKGRGWFA